MRGRIRCRLVLFLLLASSAYAGHPLSAVAGTNDFADRSTDTRLAIGPASPATHPVAVGGNCVLQRHAELALTVVQDIPLVTVSINGFNATLLLDTGSERTVLTQAAAQRLGIDLHFGYPRPMRGLAGTMITGEAKLRSFAVGSAAIANVSVLVGPVSLPNLGRATPVGLLGADILAEFDVELDLSRRRLTLYARATCPAMTPPWTHPFATLTAGRSLHDHLSVDA